MNCLIPWARRNFSASLKIVSNRAISLHKSAASNFFLSLQTLRPNTFHLLCVFGQSVCDIDIISGVHIYCEILSYYIYIWCTQRFAGKFKQKRKIPLVSPTYKYPKRCTQINVLMYITLKKDVGCWPCINAHEQNQSRLALETDVR